MKAMIVEKRGGGGKLSWQDVPIPTIGSQDLLIKVKAASINRADIFQLQRNTKLDPPVVAGLEATGEVVDVGESISNFKTGDRVAGLCTGGYAEFTTLDHRLAIPVPEHFDWPEAAAFPLGYMTEYNAMITNADLQKGQSVMITAASSGVGVAGIQLAHFFGGTPVIGASSSPHKFAKLRLLGVDRIIDYRTENIDTAIRQATKGQGVDVILDHIGGTYFANQISALAVKGRLISVGRLAGGSGELDIELLALNRLSVIGVTFRTRTLDEKIAIAQDVIAVLLPALADGRLRPIVDRIFPLEKAVEAQDYMRSNRHFGKIILKVN